VAVKYLTANDENFVQNHPEDKNNLKIHAIPI
jgi:hypothetical protein